MKNKIRIKMLGAVIILIGMLIGSSAMAQDLIFDAKQLEISFCDESMMVNASRTIRVEEGHLYGIITKDGVFHSYVTTNVKITATKRLKINIKGLKQQIKKEGIEYIVIRELYFKVGTIQNEQLKKQVK